MKDREHSFLKFKGNRYQCAALRKQFQVKQWEFDRKLRQCKRLFAKTQQTELISDIANNPKRFWGTIKNLVPKKKNMIPMKVYIDNIVTDDLNIVLCKWKTDYELLYNQCNVNDYKFIEFVAQELNNYEYSMHYDMNISFESNAMLNEPISLCEVDNAISKLKPNKSPGVDLIPNEILKQKSLLKSIFNILSTCFEQGTVPTIWNKSIISPLPKINQNVNVRL